LPLLLIHSRADEVNFLSGSQEFAAAHTGDCTLKVYEGALHDVKAEPEWDAIGADIVGWLDDHRSPAG
jgi:alpha-beta hydrolase superfamily lysophospholipase